MSAARSMAAERMSIMLQLHAEPGKEGEVAWFLRDALPTVQDEPETAR